MSQQSPKFESKHIYPLFAEPHRPLGDMFVAVGLAEVDVEVGVAVLEADDDTSQLP